MVKMVKGIRKGYFGQAGQNGVMPLTMHNNHYLF
jgi:hypothetical protein